ncbi:hypothetical protein AFCDBAGC_1272 [Methylobacterium cerastii]|uniref:Uncharacterized protein n=1 Tax=Methylobacterium cerastii TaxID=932741 RepID=A0ABQ4QF10_9HYPH|nr:hypothetical protein AFCDBAGC_1272 [Methylobacterium cerastii]
MPVRISGAEVEVLFSLPVPEMFPAKVVAVPELNASTPLFTTSPTIEPVVPPAPICSVPAEIVVPPV